MRSSRRLGKEGEVKGEEIQWERIATDMSTIRVNGNRHRLYGQLQKHRVKKRDRHWSGHFSTSLFEFVLLPFDGLSVIALDSRSLLGDPLIAAGKASDSEEPVKRFPNPFGGGDIGLSFFFQVAGLEFPWSNLPGGDAFSDELDPLLSPRSSCGTREGDSVGVVGRHPG